MRRRLAAQGIAVIVMALPQFALSAEPVCQFEDASHRRISGDNPADLKCIKALAEAGDEFQQYYLGLILVGQVPGPDNVSEGLKVLKDVASRGNKYSVDAMRFIGYVYLGSDFSFRNLELAYQWLYLASNLPPFKGTDILLPNTELSAAITPARMKELERNAGDLLRRQ